MLLTLDFETAYSTEYSLTHMPTWEYVMDPRFEIIGVGLKEGSGPSVWLPGADAVAYLRSLPWHKIALLAHNARFDAAILAWRLGCVPAFVLDTLSMAQPVIYPQTGSVALKAVAEYLCLPPKGDEVINARGKWLRDFTPEELARYGRYCCNDVDMTFQAFQLLKQHIPRSELRLINHLVRMFIEPTLYFNQNVLAEHLHEVQVRRQALLDRVSHLLPAAGRTAIVSNDQFARLLIERGIEPPRKKSPATGDQTWAFAKNDPEFYALLEHEDEEVQALVAARLGLRSTIEETRAARFLTISRHVWDVPKVTPSRLPARPQTGLVPIPIRYYAAHTGRLGGTDKLNFQNLPRGGRLRQAIEAPPGYKIVAADSSQIEARMNAYLAGQEDLVNMFRQGRDVYCEFASDVFLRKITKADKVERFIGKTSILGLGYGMGHVKFGYTVRTQSRLQLGVALDMPDQEANLIVRRYRQRFSRIPYYWEMAENLLTYIVNGEPYRLGPIEAVAGGIRLPNGMAISYPDLRFDALSQRWVTTFGKREEKFLWGGKVVENIVQALCRIIVMDQMLAIEQLHKRFASLTVHDSLVYVVPDADAELFAEELVKIMSTPPVWAPQLPLAAEVGIGQNLLDAEKH